MRKPDREVLSPGELYQELRVSVEQLGQVATALGLPAPGGSQELERLGPSDMVDLWTASRASVRHIDQAWDDSAANMVNQYLETASNSPDANAPSS